MKHPTTSGRSIAQSQPTLKTVLLRSDNYIKKYIIQVANSTREINSQLANTQLVTK